MTKILCLALLSLLASRVEAATISLTPEQSKGLVEDLYFLGVKADTSKPLYSIRIDDLSCKGSFYDSGEVTDTDWGMPYYECKKPALQGLAARTLYNALDNLQTAYDGKIYITDCGMGRCYTSLKALRCTINSAEVESAKRFACSLTDTQ